MKDVIFDVCVIAFAAAMFVTVVIHVIDIVGEPDEIIGEKVYELRN